jgi:Fis family transcriptional regulator, factor for inversion stimulation protein
MGSGQDGQAAGLCVRDGGDDVVSLVGGGAIQACVVHEMERYLNTLQGHDGVDLYRMVLEQVEPALFSAVLGYCEGNQTRAAQMLGINRATLRKKLIHYSLSP